jgi:hypothetical protein
VISAAPIPVKTSFVEKPDYLQREAADEKLLAQRRREFLEHISGARDIRIARSETAFSWKIRWRAQQRYCKKNRKRNFHEEGYYLSRAGLYEYKGQIKAIAKYA